MADARETERVHPDWVEVERNATHVKYRSVDGPVLVFTVNDVGRGVYWPNRMSHANQIVLGVSGYKAWIVGEEERFTTSEKDDPSVPYVAKGFPPLAPNDDCGPEPCSCPTGECRTHQRDPGERTGPYGGDDLGHEQVVAALTEALPANQEARKRLVAALGTELRRPVSPRFPSEARQDRALPLSNGVLLVSKGGR